MIQYWSGLCTENHRFFRQKHARHHQQNAPKACKIPGMRQKLAKICASWESQQTIRHVMIFLQSHDVSPSLGRKIFSLWRRKHDRPVESLPSRPRHPRHWLPDSRHHCQIPRHSSYPSDTTTGGIEYTLWEISQQGHTCYPQEKLKEATANLLNLEINFLDSALETLIQEESDRAE